MMKKKKIQSDEAVGRDFQTPEWDKPHGFIVPVVGSPGFALKGDQEVMDLGFPVKLQKGCLVLSLAGGVRLLRWRGEFDVWILGMFGSTCAIGILGLPSPAPHKSEVLFFHLLVP